MIRRSRGVVPDYGIHDLAPIEAYRSTRLNDAQAHDLTVRALDRRVIPASRIPRVLHEWREPRHEKFRPGTAWSRLNAVTELRKGRLHDLPRRPQPRYEICDRHVGLN